MRDRTIRRRSLSLARSREGASPWEPATRRRRALAAPLLRISSERDGLELLCEGRYSSSRSQRQGFLRAIELAMLPDTRGVRVTWHRNEHRMLQIRRRNGVWNFRLHRVFLTADAELVAALAQYAKFHDPEAGSQIRAFVDANVDAKGQAARVRGTYFDLASIFASLNRRFFDGAIIASIAWLEGEDWPGLEVHCDDAPQRKLDLAMAAYCVETRQIWVHRSLDAADIPRVYLDWVVFHEMLHQLHEMPMRQGHREHHTADFERDEALFPGREQALVWEEQHRERLRRALEQPIQRLGQ